MNSPFRPWIAPVLILALAAPALADSSRGTGVGLPSPSPAVEPRRALLRCLADLDLSTDQKSEIQAFLESQKGSLSALYQTLESDRQTLRDALESGSTDACALGTDVLAIRADRQALYAQLETIKTGVEAFLTPEQTAHFEGCLAALRRPDDLSADF